MHPERHPDDLPPPAEPVLRARRPFPRGIGWAVALAAVTIAIMAFVAIEDTQDPADRLVQNLDLPPDEGTPPDLDGTEAPPLAFEWFDGTSGSLAEYRGEPLVLNFWASWCSPCLAEMPDLEEVFRERQGTVAFLGLNVDDGIEPARRMIDQTGVTYDLARDESGDAIRSLGVLNMPTTFFIDSDGRIVETHAGPLNADQLRERIAAIPGVDAQPPGADS